MRDVKRIRMHCIRLFFLIVVLAFTGCAKKQPREEEIMSEEAKDSLTTLRQTMDGTMQLFAVAYLGYVGEQTKYPAEWIQNVRPQFMEDFPFIKEVSEKQIVGSIGDLYCIVPRDEQASVAINQLINEEDATGGAKKAGEVLYRSEAGMPVLLFCNEFRYWDRADVEITVVGANGEQVVWQPMLDEEEYVVLPQNDDGKFLAIDFTYYLEEDTDFGDMTSMGWYAPDLKDLKETTWSTWQYPEEGERIIYFLDLYGGQQSDYGEYDGEACFAWLYDGDEKYQEYYEGWWSLEEVDGQVCLRLDICRIGGVMYQDGEEVQVISNQFPVFCDMEGQSLILHKGIQNGGLLPFLNEQNDFEFLTKSVG